MDLHLHALYAENFCLVSEISKNLEENDDSNVTFCKTFPICNHNFSIPRVTVCNNFYAPGIPIFVHLLENKL